MRNSTEEDIEKLKNDPIELKRLTELAKQQEIQIDPDTFEPFIVVEDVRYNISPLKET